MVQSPIILTRWANRLLASCMLVMPESDSIIPRHMCSANLNRVVHTGLYHPSAFSSSPTKFDPHFTC
ncbi:hypothetical protein CY34DRAFT_808289 [Suillus luteus UH-Slu-Lm8-n1]|uniref:Uncharacterized protein n=1 Tax=Suillus luteus UH-Slu-Lm8-n1 TaxID=930992 RepID=A0A0D0AYR8_9AGAM|nr:hypothetical protein CY34DRAFT_808289 [Suillus luteus UH-Slu-Lm8-n1]